MKTYLDCYACFLRQALEAARLGGADEHQQHRVLSQVLGALQDADLDSTPPEMGRIVHRIVRRELGAEDPYREVKEKSTRQALNLYSRLKGLVREAPDPLACAVHLATAGNVIDFGTPDAPVDLKGLWSAVKKLLSQPLAIGHVDQLRRALSNADQVLYLSDNAGETVFDRVLIEVLDRPTLYVVKGSPILNDATREDAVAAGIDQVAQIVSNGTDAPGTILAEWSPELRAEFHKADLIIAKGQGNYETLSDADGNIFFLLKAKCPVVARDLQVSVGSIVIKRGGDGYAEI